MSLNWDCAKVADYESLKTDEEWAKTDALVWTTMLIDMGSITEKNAEEFFTRFLVARNIARHCTVPIALADVVRRVGLSTNVATKSRAAFAKRVAGWVFKDAEVEAGRQKKNLAAAQAAGVGR